MWVYVSVFVAVAQQKNMKKALSLSLAVNLEKVIWNWMEKHHDEFASLVSKPNDELAGKGGIHCRLLLGYLQITC